MKPNRLFFLFIFIVMASCTKTDMVCGNYTGQATGYFIGTNVNSTMIIKRVDDEKVNIECDFNGHLMAYPNVNVSQGNDGKYYLSEASGVQAILRNGTDLSFQYVDGVNAQNNIFFTGNK